jgi:hypothetical protein
MIEKCDALQGKVHKPEKSETGETHSYKGSDI